MFAGVFGLVHGAGFANYLKALFVERIAVPLLGFNVGIELGQLVVLRRAPRSCSPRSTVASRPSACTDALRVRVVAVSVARRRGRLAWAVERTPW